MENHWDPNLDKPLSEPQSLPPVGEPAPTAQTQRVLDTRPLGRRTVEGDLPFRLHFSALWGSVVPLANIFMPIWLWITKRHRHPDLGSHLREALNFHLSMLLLTTAIWFVLLGIPSIIGGFIFDNVGSILTEARSSGTLDFSVVIDKLVFQGKIHSVYDRLMEYSFIVTLGLTGLIYLFAFLSSFVVALKTYFDKPYRYRFSLPVFHVSEKRISIQLNPKLRPFSRVIPRRPDFVN